MSRERRQTSQTIAWFRDLYKRELLDLDPPYQRRSVWNQDYKDYFIETLLLDYPAPAVFLYEEMSPDGIARYHVVDGKQRLQTVFDFTDNTFAVSEKSALKRFQGMYFNQLPDEVRKSLWTYQFSVEYLPTTDENTLNNIFDRINRNVARLTPQELRHARFSGDFITTAESLSEFMTISLPENLPRINAASRRQMKDVELTAQLLLLTERGVDTYSQEDLDAAYSARETEWEDKQRVEEEFRQVIREIGQIPGELFNIPACRRLRNQADFYSLYGAILGMWRAQKVPPVEDLQDRLKAFMEIVSDDTREDYPKAKRYYEAARSASNDLAQRRARIDIMSEVLGGDL
ncbi:DUF262 domain-containing protein [Acrocarpospora catenulata]|uniref:DUF262 domain-containing protein n=1 Tax=Acrocarpospora catenulata TaxID=2836182 RepID=UPI001BDB6852|nr:DUF262 domain-containing protein [Acrocarpospora catenulata]